MTERDFLNHLQRASRETGYAMIDDDAAIIAPSTVFSTDQFIEGTHFLWTHMAALDLGFKAITQALSDIAAMGARPTAVLTSLAWHPKYHGSYVLDFIEGMKQACLHYKVPLAGGDISRGGELFYADISVAGFCENPLTKRGVQPGDVIAVTGTLGDARAGFELVDKKGLYPQLDERYRRPIAHIETILSLRNNNIVHSATDISDSLSKSLFSLANHSHVGFLIEENVIPISQATANYVQTHGKTQRDFVWNAGEDYQLLLALPASTPAHVFTDHGLIAIGRATENPQLLLRSDDGVHSLTEVGWDPFAL